MLLIWAWYKSSNQGNNNIGLEIGLCALGSVIAWFIVIILTALLKRIGKYSILFTFLIGLVISSLALVYIPQLHPPVEVLVSLIAFIYMCLFLPFAMLIAGNVKKALLADKEKPFYMFALTGLVIFIASKIIDLAS